MKLSRHSRKGFTLIEVIAAFVVALLLLAPITAMIGGVAGSFSGVQRSSERRTEQQRATVVAMTAAPLQPGEFTTGDYLVTIVPSRGIPPSGLESSDWQLYTVTVQDARTPARVLLETVRIGRR